MSQDAGTAGPDSEPDYRFTLANERTFLAWQRTALGLIAGGVALREFATAGPSWLTNTLAIVALGLGALVALVGLSQWRRTQQAMRSGHALAPSRAVPLLAVVLAAIALVIALGAVLS
jgi:inner membrane protein YidH